MYAKVPMEINANALVWKGIILARAGRVAEGRAIAEQIEELAAISSAVLARLSAHGARRA
jgi:hypothetical protein